MTTKASMLMSIQAIAYELGYHPTSVTRFIRDGRLKGVKLDNKWFVTKERVDEFAEKHTRHRRHSLEKAERIRQRERSEKMVKEVKIKGTTIPWKSAKILDKEETEQYLTTVRRRGSRESSKLLREFALSLSDLRRGYSKRYEFDTKEDAERVQKYLRRATELAGWYKGYAEAEWGDWTTWESHISDGSMNGASPSLMVTRLVTPKESMAVVIRRNKIKKLQEGE